MAFPDHGAVQGSNGGRRSAAWNNPPSSCSQLESAASAISDQFEHRLCLIVIELSLICEVGERQTDVDLAVNEPLLLFGSCRKPGHSSGAL